MRNNEYRLNVRFDLNDEKQRRIAETLQKLDRKKYQSINTYVVTAVGDYLDRLDNNGDLTLDRIRAMFREELQSVSFASTPPSEKNALDTSLTEEQQEENDDKVLDALAMFM